MTNNTSPLHGANNQIYVIHEKGTSLFELFQRFSNNHFHFSFEYAALFYNYTECVAGGFERWFNLTLVNISEDDADDYTCVGVNAGGVSEQNVSLTFDQPKISPDTHEPVETNPNFAVIIGAIAAGKLLQLCFNEFAIRIFVFN